jgi:DNA (cytosine-5)-methyltransferase 1
VDLFAGCGGMSLGIQEAARRSGCRTETALAIDNDPAALAIYVKNLGEKNTRVAAVQECFDGPIGSAKSSIERKVQRGVGEVDILIGGPPCQGHSDLNNHTRRKDPKNALYLRMARAAAVLRPKFVVIENVSAVQWDKGNVVATTSSALEAAGYSTAARVLDLTRLGVPQTRRRFILLASRIPGLDLRVLLSCLARPEIPHADRTVRWAIEDLLHVEGKHVFDTPSTASTANRERIRYMFEHGCYDLPNEIRPACHQNGAHSYKSVYGRLHWDRPAQTITTGFGCIGQGRYVHPQRRRTITPHEAARLQTFPDWFDFGLDTTRGVLAKTIGNAVPPFLMMRLGLSVIPSVIP